MGVLREYHAALGRPDLPLRGHPRAVHRRRADGVLQRPGAAATTRRRGPSGWPSRCAARVRGLADELGRAGATTWRFGDRHRPGLRDAGPDRLRGPLRLRRDRQRHQPGGPAVRRGRAVADPRHRAGATARQDARASATPSASCALRGLQPARPRVRRQGTRRRAGVDVMTGDVDATAPGSTLVGPRRGRALRRFDVLQARMAEVWDAMRLNHDDESVVVVPSVTLDRGRRRSGSMTQAMEERFLFLLMLLRQPRLRMVYVTSMPIAPDDRRVLPGPAARGDPEPRAGAAARWSPCTTRRPAPLSEKLLERPRLLRQHRRADPEPRPLAPGALQHHRARARRRALPRDPDVRRRPAARPTGLQDRLPPDVRRGRACRTRWAWRTCTRSTTCGRGRADAGAATGHATASSSSSTRVSPARATRSSTWRGLPAPGVADERGGRRASGCGRWSWSRRTTPLDGYVAKFAEGGGIVEERDRRRGAAQPERPAAGHCPAATVELLSTHDQLLGGAERAELPRLRVPGRLRVRPRDHRRTPRRSGERLAERGRARPVRHRLRRGPRTAAALDAVRDRAQPAQGRHHPPVPHPAVPHRRRVRRRRPALFLTPAGPSEAPGRDRPSRVTGAARAAASTTCSTSWRDTACTSTSRARPASSST